ncbi:MAG: hypothetical protein OEY44_00445 [Candidatus Peregrinibacteria bacterium]|nr:hypothetical protein [Candidatus Peregrinibacteria bacterium]
MSEVRTCASSGHEFTVSDKEIAYCERMGFPLPVISPEERIRELMAFRNEWKLYRRKCDATGEQIISAYHPDSKFKVYNNSYWWGDAWDPLEYGRDFDFSRPFFEQFAELQKVVPREGTSIFNSENCDYNSHTRESKNCYLNSLVYRCEDTYYSYWVVDDQDVFDAVCTNGSTRCYECMDCEKCYECVMLQNSKDCSDCHFSYALQNCKNCMFSNNLVGKEYYVFNKQVTPEEFEKIKAEYLNGSFESFLKGREKFFEVRNKAIHRATHNINCENVIGDLMYDSRNCELAFEGNGSEDVCNAISIADSKDVYNAYSAGWPGCEMVYSSCVTRGSQDVAFCLYTFFSSGLRYCDSMKGCHDSFGCIGLKQKKYCILNKQYTKEEYETLVPKIIEHMKKTGEWGRYFPPGLSPFAYDETPAQDYYPINKERALAMGYRWLDYQAPPPSAQKVISAGRLPDSINDTPDDVLEWAINGEITGKPFKLMSGELSFYREMKLPIPRRHPAQRHADRMKLRNPHKLWERECDSCHRQVVSSYSPDRPEIVYCEQCYLREVY